MRGLRLYMMSKVIIVLLLQFGLPILAALGREAVRTEARSRRKRLLLGVASIVLCIIPLMAYGFIVGSSPHGAAVDWYIMLCLFSFGSVPIGVATATYFATSSIAEPLVGLVCRSDVVEPTPTIVITSTSGIRPGPTTGAERSHDR